MGYKARPGNVIGYAHAYRMDDGGLKVGDKVKARHPGYATATITLDNGQKLGILEIPIQNLKNIIKEHMITICRRNLIKKGIEYLKNISPMIILLQK